MAKAEIIKKERKMKKTNKKGFTIVELVIVIAVIAILAAVLIPTFTNVVEKANQSAALQACETEYKQMAIAAASNGTTVDESVVFCKGKYYFSLENGGMTACDSSKVGTDLKATDLANSVKVYGKSGVTNNITESDPDKDAEVKIVFKATYASGSTITLTVKDENGKTYYSEWYKPSSADNSESEHSFRFYMYKTSSAWVNGENNVATVKPEKVTSKADAVGYYTYTVTNGSTVIASGIFYYGA